MELDGAVSTLMRVTGSCGRRSLEGLVHSRPAFCWRSGRWKPARRLKVDTKGPGGSGRARRPVVSAVQGVGGAEAVETAVVEKPIFRGIKVLAGTPEPFGTTLAGGGVNFAVYSSAATSAALCLFTISDLQANRVTEEIPLDPLLNKTGDVWHVFLQGDFSDMVYGYKFDGQFSPEEGHYFDPSRVLLDPYAKAVVSRGDYGVPGPGGNCWSQMAGMIPSSSDEFDWEGDLPLSYPQKDLIIYEMHVRGFTRHDSSGTKYPGTYRGMTEKLDHLKEFGVNCIELMPCHEFNELEYFSHKSASRVKKMLHMVPVKSLETSKQVMFNVLKPEATRNVDRIFFQFVSIGTSS